MPFPKLKFAAYLPHCHNLTRCPAGYIDFILCLVGHEHFLRDILQNDRSGRTHSFSQITRKSGRPLRNVQYSRANYFFIYIYLLNILSWCQVRSVTYGVVYQVIFRRNLLACELSHLEEFSCFRVYISALHASYLVFRCLGCRRHIRLPGVREGHSRSPWKGTVFRGSYDRFRYYNSSFCSICLCFWIIV